MPSHRVQRIAEAIREVVASTILFELSDPRVRGVTVVGVEVTGDLRTAVVLVSIMGTETEQRLALKGLQHATGFLQAKVAARLQIRFTPTLSFKQDEGVKRSVEVSRLIDEALEADRQAHPEPSPDATDPSPDATDPDDDASGPTPAPAPDA